MIELIRMSSKRTIVLGIETSCDETAVALVTSDGEILSQCIHSQLTEHEPYGGVVPEIAARSHLLKLPHLFEKALQDARINVRDIDAVAATSGPGLIGGVLVGMCAAKAFAFGLNLPFVPVNHLVGHALSVRLVERIAYPYLLLLVSGGHSQFVLVQSPVAFQELGSTCDDAVGETFDKVAKVLGLPYPGGPEIEKSARHGDPLRYALPKPFFKAPHCDFSLSGLKTAVRDLVARHDALSTQIIADIAASFQSTVADVIVDRSLQALQKTQYASIPINGFVVAGGVAANQYIRSKLSHTLESMNVPCVFPPLQLCTDNAAMIAWAGIEIMLYKKTPFRDYSAAAKPRWPLAEMEQVQ